MPYKEKKENKLEKVKEKKGENNKVRIYNK